MLKFKWRQDFSQSTENGVFEKSFRITIHLTIITTFRKHYYAVNTFNFSDAFILGVVHYILQNFELIVRHLADFHHDCQTCVQIWFYHGL